MAEWDLQDGESTQAFAAFAIYRDMGASYRTLAEVVVKLGKEPGYKRQIEEWSSRYRWVERCRAFDAWVDKRVQERHADAVARMHVRHIDLAVQLQTRVVERLASMTVEELRVCDIVSWVRTAANLERLARGESTENIAVTSRMGAILPEALTEEEHATMVAMLAERGQLPGTSAEASMDHLRTAVHGAGGGDAGA